MDKTGTFIAIVSGLFLWWVGYSYHKGRQPNDQFPFRLPKVASLLFGVKGPSEQLSLRGIFTQTLAYIMVPLLLLHSNGFISQRDLVTWCGGSSGVMLLLLGLLSTLAARNKR